MAWAGRLARARPDSEPEPEIPSQVSDLRLLFRAFQAHTCHGISGHLSRYLRYRDTCHGISCYGMSRYPVGPGPTRQTGAQRLGLCTGETEPLPASNLARCRFAGPAAASPGRLGFRVRTKIAPSEPRWAPDTWSVAHRRRHGASDSARSVAMQYCRALTHTLARRYTHYAHMHIHAYMHIRTYTNNTHRGTPARLHRDSVT